MFIVYAGDDNQNDSRLIFHTLPSHEIRRPMAILYHTNMLHRIRIARGTLPIF